jgi:hypothetical protein
VWVVQHQQMLFKLTDDALSVHPIMIAYKNKIAKTKQKQNKTKKNQKSK